MANHPRRVRRVAGFISHQRRALTDVRATDTILLPIAAVAGVPEGFAEFDLGRGLAPLEWTRREYLISLISIFPRGKTNAKPDTRSGYTSTNSRLDQ
jgi:hypothetical protein